MYVDFVNKKGEEREASIRIVNKVLPELTEPPYMMHRQYNIIYVDNNKYKFTRQS